MKAAVQTATHRDLVKVEHEPASTASDLLDLLTRAPVESDGLPDAALPVLEN